MVAMGAKELFEVVIGAGQLRAIITMERPRPIAVRDLAEVGEHGAQGRSAEVLGACHSPEQSAEASFDTRAIECIGIGQNVGRTLHPGICCPHQGPEQSRAVIAFGFPQGLDPDVEFLLFQMTGKHPYLLQGLLEHIWENQTTLDRQVVRRAAWEFLHQQSTFPRWLDAFGLEDHAVYQCLAETPEGTLHVRDIRHRLDAALSSKVDDALTVLSYHGVVDDSEPDEPRLAGTLFRDWYRENRLRLPHGELPQPKLLSLFCSYSHRDEALRHALETHLALLRRQGVYRELV